MGVFSDPDFSYSITDVSGVTYPVMASMSDDSLNVITSAVLGYTSAMGIGANVEVQYSRMDMSGMANTGTAFEFSTGLVSAFLNVDFHSVFMDADKADCARGGVYLSAGIGLISYTDVNLVSVDFRSNKPAIIAQDTGFAENTWAAKFKIGFEQLFNNKVSLGVNVGLMYVPEVDRFDGGHTDYIVYSTSATTTFATVPVIGIDDMVTGMVEFRVTAFL